MIIIIYYLNSLSYSITNKLIGHTDVTVRNWRNCTKLKKKHSDNVLPWQNQLHTRTEPDVVPWQYILHSVQLWTNQWSVLTAASCPVSPDKAGDMQYLQSGHVVGVAVIASFAISVEVSGTQDECCYS